MSDVATPPARTEPELHAVCGDAPLGPPYEDIAACPMLTEWSGEIPEGHHGMCFRCMDNWVTAGAGWCCPFCRIALKHTGFARIRERQGSKGPYAVIDFIRSDKWADPPPTPREAGPEGEHLHEQATADMSIE